MSIFKCDSYTHPHPPKLNIERRRLGDVEGAQQAERVRWSLKGMLTGSQSQLKTEIAALEAAYAADGVDVTLYADDGVTVLHQLLNSSCLNGTKIVQRPSFPEGEGAEYATKRTYTVVVEGDVAAADAPSATSRGNYTTSQNVDQEGQVRVLVQGEYHGPGAATAVQAAIDTVDVVEDSTIDTDEDTGAVRFSARGRTTGTSRATIRRVETYEYQAAMTLPVFLQLLDGTIVKQTTVSSIPRARQFGEAVGLSGYPDPPDPRHPSDLAAPPRITKRCPSRTGDGTLLEYVTAWEYEFAFTSDPTWATPNNPPAA